jgi:Holliday junction resolvase-like predicted endonuclease
VSTRLEVGRRAELLVAADLERRGYRVLALNKRVGRLEIDLVALSGDGVAVLFEVRSRGAGAYERAFASIAGKKRMRLLHAADRLWRFELARRADVRRMRIDVASVTFVVGGGVVIEYAEGAIVGG